MFKQDPEQHFDKKAYEKLLKGMSKDLAASRQIVKNEKIYPNDPCPCGSGKKYKKCCMNKPQTQSNIEQVREDREKWLKCYPPKAEPRVKDRIYLEDFYDNESIEIDKLIYLALMHRPGLPSERGTEAEQRARQRYYLWEAFKIFQEKCNREGIQTFAEYDAKYMIHYDSKRWMKYLEHLLSGNKTKAEQRRVIDLQTALRTAEI
ncbi:MAG: SEC-C metal-binding domain-containing protein [Lachnospiraceae bacterium]